MFIYSRCLFGVKILCPMQIITFQTKWKKSSFSTLPRPHVPILFSTTDSSAVWRKTMKKRSSTCRSLNETTTTTTKKHPSKQTTSQSVAKQFFKYLTIYCCLSFEHFLFFSSILPLACYPIPSSFFLLDHILIWSLFIYNTRKVDVWDENIVTNCINWCINGVRYAKHSRFMFDRFLDEDDTMQTRIIEFTPV